MAKDPVCSEKKECLAQAREIFAHLTSKECATLLEEVRSLFRGTICSVSKGSEAIAKRLDIARTGLGALDPTGDRSGREIYDTLEERRLKRSEECLVGPIAGICLLKREHGGITLPEANQASPAPSKTAAR